MGKVFSIVSADIRGVDGNSDPLKVGPRKFRHSVNLQYQSGRVRTRPVFDYMKTGLTGQFQGATMFRPARGISFRPFGPCGSRLATAIGGKVFVNHAPSTGVVCDPMELEKPKVPCYVQPDKTCVGDVNLYQAENYLVIQSFRDNTMWWTGEGPLVVSKGMTPEEEQTDGNHSHDTMVAANNKNFLINGAGLGIFWNGRIHQQGPNAIYVGDILHKRGSMTTEDIVLMEEQSLKISPTLSTNSKMGALLALEGVPRMNTPNGEGLLVGYHEGGIVSYNTFLFPRLSTFTAKGIRIESGWDTKQLTDHNCNVISATGRYAVGVLPRDHFFRSGFGIHVLSRVLGVEFINDEPVNVISDEVSNVLNEDDPTLLHGAAAGCWLRGNRWFMTTGFEYCKTLSSSPIGRGFVSWNKVWSRTEDNTPLSTWEGVWVVDKGLKGIHRFISTGMSDDRGSFGFLASDNGASLWYAAIQCDGAYDVRNGQQIPVPWVFETGRYNFEDTSRTKEILEGRFEGVFFHKGIRVTIYVRTDQHPRWSKWRTFSTVEKDLDPGDGLSVSKQLGVPDDRVKEGTWFEFRVEGTGAAEITAFEIDISEGSSKMSNDCRLIHACPNTNPLTTAL